MAPNSNMTCWAAIFTSPRIPKMTKTWNQTCNTIYHCSVETTPNACLCLLISQVDLAKWLLVKYWRNARGTEIRAPKEACVSRVFEGSSSCSTNLQENRRPPKSTTRNRSWRRWERPVSCRSPILADTRWTTLQCRAWWSGRLTQSLIGRFA